MTADDPLLSPFTLRTLHFKNRVMSTAHEPAYSDDGMPKERYIAYHAEKARGGMALTMTAGSAVVSPDSPPAFGNLHAYRDDIVPWIRRLTDAVHEHNCLAMIQISHLGRRTGWGHDDWLPLVAPSPVREPAHRSRPKQAEDWDLRRIIGQYADAAERMQRGGMDGVEIEAYGHLFEQFLSPLTNHRDDAWGGDPERRLHFPLLVLRAVRERVGNDFVLGLRMVVDEARAGGIDAATGLDALQRFSDEGLIDFVNVIRGTIADDPALAEVIPLHGMPSAPHLDFTGMVRASCDLAVFHAAKIDDVATARHAIREGRVDMIGMTRAHLADPHIVRKIQLGRESSIRPCVGATYCLDRIYMSGEALCMHNAATGRELTMPHDIPRATIQRRVVIVGAGPGGLEAARVAGERGHHVTLLEAMPWAGGQVRLAARNPRRRDLLGIVDWRVAELHRLGVDVRYDVYAAADDVVALVPDVVIVATGGTPLLPDVAEGGDLLIHSWEVIDGSARVSGDILLYDDDGTHSAMSAAELLALGGSRLEVVTPERSLGVDVGGLNLVPYARALSDSDARITLHQRVQAVRRTDDGRLRVELGNEHSPIRHSRIVDAVVGDHGVAADDALYHSLVTRSSNLGEVDQRAIVDGTPQAVRSNPSGSFQLFRIGDAVAGRNIHAAIFDALRLCKDL